MDIIYALLPLSVLLALCGVVAYLWCVKSGQYKDLDSPSVRILFEDEEK